MPIRRGGRSTGATGFLRREEGTNFAPSSFAPSLGTFEANQFANDVQQAAPNPVAFNPLSGGSSLGVTWQPSDPSPVKPKSRAYQNWQSWVQAHGGVGNLNRQALREGTLDRIDSPEGPEYFSGADDIGGAAGAGLYDDERLDIDMESWAYPETWEESPPGGDISETNDPFSGGSFVDDAGNPLSPADALNKAVDNLSNSPGFFDIPNTAGGFLTKAGKMALGKVHPAFGPFRS